MALFQSSNDLTQLRADHHQIWYEGKGASVECQRQTGSDVTKPEVTTKVLKWHLKTDLLADHHQIWHEGRGASEKCHS